MTVLTLSRQLGSRGDEVATIVADRLGLRLVGRELLNRAAREAGAPEVALAEIDELGLLGLRPSRAALALYGEKLAGAIHEQAALGDVLIVGRGAQIVLMDQPDVLHVRASAPLPVRIALVQARWDISAEAAAARVHASDRAQAAFLKRIFGVDGEDPQLYDLMLNLGRMTPDAAAALVCTLAGPRPTSPGCSCGDAPA